MSFTVSAINVAGETLCTVSADGDWTVFKLQLAIATQGGAPATRQKLVFEENTLKKTQLLRDVFGQQLMPTVTVAVMEDGAEKDEAAIKIGSMFRGRRARKEVAQARVFHEAAPASAHSHMSFSVSAVNVAGETECTVIADGDWTVLKLQHAIAAQGGTPAKLQTLIFEENVLQKTQLLRDVFGQQLSPTVTVAVVEDEVEQNAAANKIVSMFRGHRARKKVAQVREAVVAALESREAAVVAAPARRRDAPR